MLRRVRRRAFVALTFGLLALTPGAALAVDVPAGGRIGALPGWPRILAQTTQVQTLRPGVRVSAVDLLTDKGLIRIHQIDADLSSPGVSVATVVSHDSVVSTGETVTSMANRTGALAGVNADYFAIHASGVPLNWTVQNGNLIRSGNHWAVFGMNGANQVSIGKYTWEGSLRVLDSGLTFPIEALNLPLMDHKIIAVTQSMGSVLAAKNATLVGLTPGADGTYSVAAVSQNQS
ncbi:MAG: hypothetical protein JOZ39_01620, partial [Chloroflexi bacterium]|nr:hypothetical protein [Chloroflexota bacterium]